jgi:hypothetical protein
MAELAAPAVPADALKDEVESDEDDIQTSADPTTDSVAAKKKKNKKKKKAAAVTGQSREYRISCHLLKTSVILWSSYNLIVLTAEPSNPGTPAEGSTTGQAAAVPDAAEDDDDEAEGAADAADGSGVYYLIVLLFSSFVHCMHALSPLPAVLLKMLFRRREEEEKEEEEGHRYVFALQHSACL